MKVPLLSSLSLFAAVCVFLPGGPDLGAEEKITVRKMGNDFAVRSEFSADHDLVILNSRFANETTYLLPKNVPLKDYGKKGRMIHCNSDGYPASLFIELGTLSGNHGSPFARILLIPDHKMTTADIGGKITEKDGYPYIIMQIVNKDSILIHPLDSGNSYAPGMRRHSRAPLFYKGKPLAFQKSIFKQMYPLNRVTDYRLLADGTTPVPENTDVVCSYVDFIFVHDVISPAAAARSVMENPGKKPSPEWRGKWCMTLAHTPELRARYPEYMKLPALATFSNRYRFEARGASVLYRKAVYHQKLKGVRSLDVMYEWTMGEIVKNKKQYFYIPKMKPLQLKTRGGKPPVLSCDLSSNYLMPQEMDVSVRLTPNVALDPKDLPDRFIRTTGNDGPELGIALGYSLINGCTAKARQGADREWFYHLYRSKKMYPFAYTLKEIAPGKTMETVAYKQYFNPKLEPDATSLYWHREGKSWLVYMDFHKELKNKLIRLPGHLAGKKLTVVEKTPSLTFHAKDVMPADGLRVDVAGGYGYLVLKLD